MRRARQIACLLLIAVVAGCGGGDDDGGKTQLSAEGDRKGAEQTVRDYLRALVDEDGAKACSKLTPAYQQSVLKQNAEFARRQKADTCAELIDAITRVSGSVTFEGQPLNAQSVGKLKLIVTVREGGREQNATVTGAEGLQRYELVTNNGKWLIGEITRSDG
jgi:hypothetical protein